jgi:hypothetical protein
VIVRAPTTDDDDDDDERERQQALLRQQQAARDREVREKLERDRLAAVSDVRSREGGKFFRRFFFLLQFLFIYIFIFMYRIGCMAFVLSVYWFYLRVFLGVA